MNHDNQLLPLMVAMDTADPPVSPFLRKLYIEYAQRMGYKPALEMWHGLRAQQFRNPTAVYNEIRLVSDELRKLDRAEEMVEQWTQCRDTLNAAKPMYPTLRTVNLEIGGMLFGIFLCMAAGTIFGLIWSTLQGSH